MNCYLLQVLWISELSQLKQGTGKTQSLKIYTEIIKDKIDKDYEHKKKILEAIDRVSLSVSNSIDYGINDPVQIH